MRPPSVWRWPHRYSEPWLQTVTAYILWETERVQLATVPHKLTQISCTYHTLLCQLHWLPVQHRITYKLAVLTYKVRTTSKPAYPESSHHATWQHVDSTLDHNQSIICTTFAKYAPATWNSPPRTVTKNNSLGTFKSRLKTFLFFF